MIVTYSKVIGRHTLEWRAQTKTHWHQDADLGKALINLAVACNARSFQDNDCAHHPIGGGIYKTCGRCNLLPVAEYANMAVRRAERKREALLIRFASKPIFDGARQPDCKNACCTNAIFDIHRWDQILCRCGYMVWGGETCDKRHQGAYSEIIHGRGKITMPTPSGDTAINDTKMDGRFIDVNDC